MIAKCSAKLHSVFKVAVYRMKKNQLVTMGYFNSVGKAFKTLD